MYVMTYFLQAKNKFMRFHLTFTLSHPLVNQNYFLFHKEHELEKEFVCVISFTTTTSICNCLLSMCCLKIYASHTGFVTL